MMPSSALPIAASSTSDWRELFLRMILAAAVGGVIGFNRDIHGKPTGIRLHSMVAFGSALFILSVSSTGDLANAARVVQGIVSGIGFLGAGVIMRGDNARVAALNKNTFDKINIHHLTTAASIWLTAALGVVAALGEWRLALFTTTLTLVILIFGAKLDHKFFRLESDDSPTD